MITKAIKQAKKSVHKYQLGAVVSHGNKVLGVGHNQVNRHQSRIRTGHWPGSYHAEVACVIDALRRTPVDRLKGATVTVVRLGKDDKLMLALPCSDCYNFMQNLGIREVVFSDTDGNFNSLRF